MNSDSLVHKLLVYKIKHIIFFLFYSLMTIFLNKLQKFSLAQINLNDAKQIVCAILFD